MVFEPHFCPPEPLFETCSVFLQSEVLNQCCDQRGEITWGAQGKWTGESSFWRFLQDLMTVWMTRRFLPNRPFLFSKGESGLIHGLVLWKSMGGFISQWNSSFFRGHSTFVGFPGCTDMTWKEVSPFGDWKPSALKRLHCRVISIPGISAHGSIKPGVEGSI